MPFVIDGARQLLRNEGQNFFVAFTETYVFAVALHHQHAESLVAGAQRNSHPIQRRRADQFHLAARYEFVEDFRCRQKGSPVRSTYSVRPRPRRLGDGAGSRSSTKWGNVSNCVAGS